LNFCGEPGDCRTFTMTILTDSSGYSVSIFVNCCWKINITIIWLVDEWRIREASCQALLPSPTYRLIFSFRFFDTEPTGTPILDYDFCSALPLHLIWQPNNITNKSQNISMLRNCSLRWSPYRDNNVETTQATYLITIILDDNSFIHAIIIFVIVLTIIILKSWCLPLQFFIFVMTIRTKNNSKNNELVTFMLLQTKIRIDRRWSRLST
jgi:hypothetical protein